MLKICSFWKQFMNEMLTKIINKNLKVIYWET